jgi:hypothetical protein
LNGFERAFKKTAIGEKKKTRNEVRPTRFSGESDAGKFSGSSVQTTDT